MRQSSSSDTATGSVGYAEGFSVSYHDDYTFVEVRSPWGGRHVLQQYVLVDRNREIPAGLPAGTIVRVPVRNLAVYSSIHCAALAELGVADCITGVCESRYILDPTVQSRIKEGLAIDLGETSSPNIEKMVELGIEAVLVSPFQNVGYGAVEKMGIPILECADYMETNPLGRAEWIRFIGLLTGREAQADSLFAETETRYEALQATVAEVAHRPTLLPGLRYGAAWYMPPHDSYMAHLYKDAGADYLFDYLPGIESTPLTFETVLDKAIHADIWIFNYNKSEAMTYPMLRSEYSPYSSFDAFRNRRVYGCNTHSSLYYEEVSMHPDCLLRELIGIFHPELLPDYQLRYFRPLKD
jgi:iron complex transport system substrate-binding protein